jgi:calcium-dependent protein kinase
MSTEEALSEELLLSASFFKRSKKETELTQREFYLTRKFLYYKKTTDDAKIRGAMQLKNVRMEYSVPQGYVYPKIQQGKEVGESLNKRKKQEMADEDSLSQDSLTADLFSIRLIKNMKFTEVYTSDETTFLQWMDVLKTIVIQTDFHANYDVIKMLGKGSFARVYLAQCRATGEQFAVKAFSKEYIESQDKGKESLIIEINVMKELNHPNVIKFYEIHETQNSLYLVMEVLNGGEIFDLADGKLSLDETYEIVKSLLKGIQYLDSKGIIHRDLKPDNIILKHKNTPIKDNVIKIVDFGLSTFIDVEEYLFKRCGTPGFVAPEVINANKTDPNLRFSSKCDVFSVGIIFYFMLTGKIPYDGESFHDVLANNKKADIDFNLPYLKKIDPVALDLLKKMLDLDVEARYSASECLQHDYFDEDCEYSEVRRDSINLNDNIQIF